jgi:hypothetical protein
LSSKQYGTGQVFANEWEPRAGFNWLMDEHGRRRVFGSYGRFYQEQLLNLASLYFTDYFSSTAFYKTDPRLTGAKRDTLRGFIDYGSQHKNVPDASAERVDEFTLGYEQRIGQNSLVTIRGIRRSLGTTFQQGIDSVGFHLGTPGRGPLSFLPRARRDYNALEISSDGAIRTMRYRASYVLSRVWGNFPGLFGSDLFFYPNPGVDYGLTVPFQAVNSTGYLPNDRTHALKLSAAWSPIRSFKLGSFFTWQSGTPLNEFGEANDFLCGGGCFPKFLVQRGAAGRTPNLADLNIRATYDASLFRTARAQYVVDLLHLMNQQKAVRIDQQHYRGFTVAGGQLDPNPGFMKPLVYAPPFTARVGMEMKF